MTYIHTPLWKRAFGDLPNDIHREQRELLRAAYIALRKRAEVLVSNISADLRQYTMHDITHLDALWGIASELVGPNFDLTPTEGFILGASFLLHDAGMCVAAYPGGFEELKTHRLWPSTLRKFAKTPESPDQNEISAAVADLLRMEHANRARDLPNIEWTSPKGGNYYLIEDADLRQKFANAIGEVSASHWWSHDKIASSLDRILPAPPPFPTDWRADLLKLAAILRVADAAHIDERRAPGFAWALRSPLMSGSSNLHWLFQNRLTQPERRDDALYYSSTSDFIPSEAESWWLANDTLRMIDRELRSTDVLLADLRGKDLRLAARRVANIESTTTMVNSLRVRDWIPIDTKIKISDVPNLVRSLGGRALYGDSAKIPLRELLQNAADAIRLKAAVLPSFPLSAGLITASVGKDADGIFLQVTDNGIGMTRDILGGAFIDFGNSGWSNDPVFLDYPETNPQKLKMIGKFGIGFFSTFMIGDKVEVTTRRFDRGFQDTLILSFFGGVERRPILKEAPQSEWLIDGGTSVKVWIKDESKSIGELFGEGESNSLPRVCEHQFPLSEIAIRTVLPDNTQTIEPINWREVDADVLFKRISGAGQPRKALEKFLGNLRPIYDPDGNTAGRLCVAPSMFSFIFETDLTQDDFDQQGVVTSRGISVSQIFGVYGVVEGEVRKANRSLAWPSPSREEFHRWLREQADLLSQMSLSAIEEVACAQIILSLGGDTGELGICELDERALTRSELREFVLDAEEITIAPAFEMRTLKKLNPTATPVPNLILTQASFAVVFSSDSYEDRYDKFLRGDQIEKVDDLIFEIAKDCWKLDEQIVETLKKGELNKRRIIRKAIIAKTTSDEEISGNGVRIWKGMLVDDLQLAPRL